MAIDDGAAVKLGTNALFGLAAESTYGTRVAPGRSMEVRSEGLTETRERIQSQGLRKQSFNPRWAAGPVSVDGDVTLEVPNQGFGLILEHALGNVATTELTAGESYEHKFTPATSLVDKSLSCQVVMDDQPKDAIGCKIGSLALSCATGEILTATVSLIGRELLTNQTAHSAQIPTGLDLLTWVHGSLTIGGTAHAINSFEATIDNGLEANRRRFGSLLRRNPQRTSFRSFSGTFNADFTDLTLYNQFVAGSEAELVMEFVGGQIAATSENYTIRVTSNVRFDGDTPTVGGPEEIRQPISFTAVPTDAGGDSAALTIDYITSDSTP